jgi:alpha-L-fucosidase
MLPYGGRCFWLCIAVAAMLLSCPFLQGESMAIPLPKPRQLKFQDWEFGVFIHFLVGLYQTPEYRAEKKPAPARLFAPTQLDCDQWARTAAAAGAKYMVFTAKHHDGFCLWPSALTPEYSVAAAPWKDGKGDVVRQYVDACRRHNLAVGIYYSPFDVHSPFYKTDAKKYDDYFIGHMRELLGNYGRIDVLWFDGAFSEGHVYDWPRIIGEIRRMQPEVLIFNMGDPDYRWVGNESGIAPMPCWNVVEQVPFSIESDQVDRMPEPMWLPAECDCRIRYQGWTWRGPHDPLKSVEELMGLYYLSVGRGCNLLLNVGPDQRGLVHEDDAARLLEFGREVKRRFGSPLCTLKDCRRDGSQWVYEPKAPFLMDHAIVQEDIAKGEHIRRYRIWMWPAPGGGPVCMYEGQSVGHKAICRFPQVKALKAALEIVQSDGEVAMGDLQFHNVAGERQ